MESFDAEILKPIIREECIKIIDDMISTSKDNEEKSDFEFDTDADCGDLLTNITDAALEGDAKKIEYFLKSLPKDEVIDEEPNSYLGYGTPLFLAVEYGKDLELIKSLIMHSDLSKRCSLMHLTPLHLAAKKGNLGAVELLLEAESEIDPHDKNKQTPLHWAASKGHLDVVKLLYKKGANIHEKNHMNYSSFDLAVRNHHFKVAEYFLYKGVDILLKDSFCKHVKELDLAVIEFFLENGVDIDEKVYVGEGWYSLLDWAAITRNLKAVKFLLARGAAPYGSNGVIYHTENVKNLSYFLSKENDIEKVILEYLKFR